MADADEPAEAVYKVGVKLPRFTPFLLRKEERSFLFLSDRPRSLCNFDKSSTVTNSTSLSLASHTQNASHPIMLLLIIWLAWSLIMDSSSSGLMASRS